MFINYTEIILVYKIIINTLINIILFYLTVTKLN